MFFIKGEKFINWLELYTKLVQRPIGYSENIVKEYLELKHDKNRNLYFEKGEKKMRYFFVDYENVNSQGLEGCED